MNRDDITQESARPRARVHIDPKITIDGVLQVLVIGAGLVMWFAKAEAVGPQLQERLSSVTALLETKIDANAKLSQQATLDIDKRLARIDAKLDQLLVFPTTGTHQASAP
ncbi:MAG: hypothetical protein HY749_16155 [Gammaproteobacteria bacterium]|nr:hypothetical protein [Gammaproteobacteria bacterium]